MLDPIGFDSGLSMAKKKRKRTTLDEKIKKVLNDEALVQPNQQKDDRLAEIEEDEKMNQSDNVDDDEEEIMIHDNVREKNTTLKVREDTNFRLGRK